MTSKKAPTLAHRLSALERRMARAESLLEPLLALPAQLLDVQRLVQGTLPQMQERIDHLHAVIIDENEKTRAEMRALLREMR